MIGNRHRQLSDCTSIIRITKSDAKAQRRRDAKEREVFDRRASGNDGWSFWFDPVFRSLRTFVSSRLCVKRQRCFGCSVSRASFNDSARQRLIDSNSRVGRAFGSTCGRWRIWRASMCPAGRKAVSGHRTLLDSHRRYLLSRPQRLPGSRQSGRAANGRDDSGREN